MLLNQNLSDKNAESWRHNSWQTDPPVIFIITVIIVLVVFLPWRLPDKIMPANLLLKLQNPRYLYHFILTITSSTRMRSPSHAIIKMFSVDLAEQIFSCVILSVGVCLKKLFLKTQLM